MQLAAVLSDHEDLWRNETRIFVDYLEALQVPREGSAAVEPLFDVVEGGHVLRKGSMRAFFHLHRLCSN